MKPLPMIHLSEEAAPRERGEILLAWGHRPLFACAKILSKL